MIMMQRWQCFASCIQGNASFLASHYANEEKKTPASQQRPGSFINYIYGAEVEYWVCKAAAEKENKRLFAHCSWSRKGIDMSAEMIVKSHLHNESTTPPLYVMTLRRAGKSEGWGSPYVRVGYKARIVTRSVQHENAFKWWEHRPQLPSSCIKGICWLNYRAGPMPEEGEVVRFKLL